MLKQPNSRHFSQNDVKYPISEEVPFLYEDSTQSSTFLQDHAPPINLLPQGDIASQPPNVTCPFASDSLYTIEPPTHHSTLWSPQPVHGSAANVLTPPIVQGPSLIPGSNFQPQASTPEHHDSAKVASSASASAAKNAPCSHKETLQRVPLSSRHADVSFDNGHNLGLSISLAIDPQYLRHPSLCTLEDCFYPKKNDLRKRMTVHLPSLPPSCLSATYTFSLAQDTGLRLKVRIPSPCTTSIRHTDSLLGRLLCLEVILQAPTIPSTLATYSFVKLDSESSEVRLDRQLSAPTQTLDFSTAHRHPLAKQPMAKQPETTIINSRRDTTSGGLGVDTSSSLSVPSYSNPFPENAQPHGDGLLLLNTNPFSSLEFFPQLKDIEQNSVGEASAITRPLLPLCPDTTPSLRSSPSQTSFGKKRRRSGDSPREWPLPPSHPPLLSPSMDESKYFDYDPYNENGGADGGVNGDCSDTDLDTGGESDDEGPDTDDQPGPSTFDQKKTLKNSYMWRKLGPREIACSYGWHPSDGNTIPSPCNKIYQRTSNCTSHYQKKHLNANLKWPCCVNICRKQPKQPAAWKGRGKLLYSCEDMGCLEKCDNQCQASFETQETLVRHRNKHSIAHWLKCLHSDRCGLTFENSDLRNKHHSICFPGCPLQGTTCTHSRPKPKSLHPTNDQK